MEHNIAESVWRFKATDHSLSFTRTLLNTLPAFRFRPFSPFQFLTQICPHICLLTWALSWAFPWLTSPLRHHSFLCLCLLCFSETAFHVCVTNGVLRLSAYLSIHHYNVIFLRLVKSELYFVFFGSRWMTGLFQGLHKYLLNNKHKIK